MCDVCQAANCKYKCPSCRALSCSLTCFKKHKAECSSAEIVAASPQTSNSAKLEQPLGTVSHGGVDLSRLEALFTRYPSLRSQLREIYLSTLEPGRRPLNQLDFSHRSDIDPRRRHASNTGSWNTEKGLESGMGTLRAMLDSKHSIAEAIQEFLDATLPLRNVDHTAPSAI